MINPFSHNYFIGYVNQVNPQYLKVHFPSSVLLNKFIFSGEEFNGGLIGDFVTIESENYGFIGKILELDLPERERLGLSEKSFQSSEFHPTAKVEVLLSFDYFNHDVINRGLDCFPNIGSKVYVCPSEFIQKYLLSFGVKGNSKELLMNIGVLTTNKNTSVIISQQSLLSRHCAIVGTTGGGKSWTVARLIQHLKDNKSKVILIDPTGEYKPLINDLKSVNCELGVDTYFDYRKLTIEDLFFLLKPAGRVQQPKLLEAIRSLKAYNSDKDNELNTYKNGDGILRKINKDKRTYEKYYYKNIKAIDNGLLEFDITKLPSQITQECIYDTDRNNEMNYGGKNENDVSNCVSLISRTSNLINTEVFNNIFGFDVEANSKLKELSSHISSFLESDTENLLRISFEKVGFEYQAREIIANAIGKYLLQKAREDAFKSNPLVLILDEAHQFLNTHIVDDYFQNTSLTAYDQIAKECRKYGLFLCIATQMPRDIPVGTLSQMGTFIVHRLINYNDKEAIRQACSSANNSILSFLPVLGEGEAILTGVDFPMPLSIKINIPQKCPDSETPRFNLIE